MTQAVVTSQPERWELVSICPRPDKNGPSVISFFSYSFANKNEEGILYFNFPAVFQIWYLPENHFFFLEMVFYGLRENEINAGKS